MKAKERHQLKQNDFATTAVGLVEDLRANQSRAVAIAVAVLVVLGIGAGVYYWRTSQANRAGALLGVALTVSQGPIAPPSTLPGATQAPGSHASAKARSEAAVKAFDAVVAAYPSTDAAIAADYLAGGELLSLGRTADAEARFNKVIATNSAVYAPMARLGLAEARLVAGKFDEAVKMFSDLSSERDGALPVDGVLMQLADAQVKAGKSQDARATYKRVVDEFGESPYAADARQRMTAIN